LHASQTYKKKRSIMSDFNPLLVAIKKKVAIKQTSQSILSLQFKFFTVKDCTY